VFSVRAMCRCLRIHPSGFYAWLKDPLSERDREDARHTELIRKAWKDSVSLVFCPTLASPCRQSDRLVPWR
jgi:hypothetical protein